MANPFDVVKSFEADLCEYTGAPYAVTTNSCTMAMLLSVAWNIVKVREQMIDADRLAYYKPLRVSIPKRTYVSVPMSVIHAGGKPTFRDEDWSGCYRLDPLPVWDSARWLTSGHYRMVCERLASSDGQFVCLSFHASKTLGFTQGGAILHDNPEADAWLRRARFDGRAEGVAPKDDTFPHLGWHCYLSPSDAAGLRLRLHSLPKHNDPLPNDPYPDLSTLEVFK